MWNTSAPRCLCIPPVPRKVRHWTTRQGTQYIYLPKWCHRRGCACCDGEAGGSDGEAGGSDGEAGGSDGEAGGSDGEAGGSDGEAGGSDGEAGGSDGEAGGSD